MSKATTYFNRDRYYTFSHHDKYCVGYFYRGSNLQHTVEFDDQNQRADWVSQNLSGFYPISPTITG